MCWFLKASNPPMSSPINNFNFVPQREMISIFLPYMVRHTRLFNLHSYYCFPSILLRYVDGTFILWSHQEDVQILLNHVNSIRPSIQFPMEKEQDNKLPFLDVLVTRTEQGFRSSVYCKPTFTRQYLNFNSHHPYTVKKGIVRCLQHRAKNLHRNNYPESITSAPRNLDRRMEDNTRKLTTVCLPCQRISQKDQKDM